LFGMDGTCWRWMELIQSCLSLAHVRHSGDRLGGQAVMKHYSTFHCHLPMFQPPPNTFHHCLPMFH
jgi:hypothetical protein